MFENRVYRRRFTSERGEIRKHCNAKNYTVMNFEIFSLVLIQGQLIQ
jgi:hypothetical protein